MAVFVISWVLVLGGLSNHAVEPDCSFQAGKTPHERMAKCR